MMTMPIILGITFGHDLVYRELLLSKRWCDSLRSAKNARMTVMIQTCVVNTLIIPKLGNVLQTLEDLKIFKRLDLFNQIFVLICYVVHKRLFMILKE